MKGNEPSSITGVIDQPESDPDRRRFLSTAMPGAWLDARGRFVEINEAATELLEVVEKFLVGRPAISIMHPEDRHDIVQFLIDANTDGEGTIRREVRILSGDGPRRVVMALAYFDDPGDTGFFLQLHDATDLRATETALRESDARYQQFFEDHTVAMYRMLPSGEIVEANHAMARLAGFPHPKYLLSLNASRMFLRPAERDALNLDLDRLGAIAGRDFEMIRPDGSAIWVRDFARAVRRSDGSIVYEGALFDVTERYVAETQLRNRALQQASVSALGQLALQSRDAHAVALSAVRMAQEVLRMDSVVLLRGDPLARFAHWDSQEATTPPFDRIDFEWLADQVPQSHKSVVLPTPWDGFVALLPVPDVDGGTALLAAYSATDPELTDDDIHFIQAISAVIAASLEQRESRRRLESLVASKDEFIASISHEVRTPLTVVMGVAHEMSDRWRDLEPTERDDLLALVVGQTEEMSNLVEDLLVAARADIGKLPIHVEPIDIGPVIADVVASVTTPPDVVVELSPHNPTCYADPVRFRQIVRNLLTNAFRYGGDKINISINHSDETVWVDVADNGDGVEAESRETIFEAYERAHRFTGQPGSVGLGLTVARRLARLMDGDLTYRFDGGSVFTLELAAAPNLMFWNATSDV